MTGAFFILVMRPGPSGSCCVRDSLQRAQRGLVNTQMAYVITEPCIGTKDKSCVDVCPVDCIHGGDDEKQLFIDPEVCIDCGACVSACPVEAIYADSDVPDKWKNFIAVNAEFFKN